MFVVLPLLWSCADRSTTAPLTNAAAAPGIAAAQPLFIVEPTVINVPTYDGSGQSVHPDVVAFHDAWHGSRYWFTMTPYPKSNQVLENPSILTSDNGVTVTVPAGLQNPVVEPPRNSKNYNSDPELVYEAQTGRLVLFHRLVEKRTNTIHVTTSKDGITWTRTPAPFWERSHRAVSPTVAPRTGAPARMWYVNAGKDGCGTTASSVLMRTASDSTGRIVDTKWIGPVPTDLAIPGYLIWHIKARWIESKSEYWMLISAFPVNGNGCKTDDLFFARSADGVHWKTYAEPVLRHQEREWTAAAVYRTSFLYDAARNELSLWISARGSDGAWNLGYARLGYSALLAALQKGGPLTNRRPAYFAAPSMAGEQP